MINKMIGKVIILSLCALFLVSAFLLPAFAEEMPSIEPFQNTDRVLIVSPHPDDDIIGCAGVIQEALKANAKVRVVYITCGDNNIFSLIFYNDLFSLVINNKILYLVELALNWKERFIKLGRIRMREAINAQRVLGLEEKDLVFLGYPDHGTDQMFVFYWDSTRPYSESLAGNSFVPYEKGLDYSKVFTAENIINDLKDVISDFKPTKVFVAHPSDLNGDHWASYLYTKVSLLELANTMPEPKVYSYLVHVPDWPLPRHYHPELAIGPPEKFFGDTTSLNDWHQLKLTKDEINKKYEAMSIHASQMSVSAFYLLSFVRRNEIFGNFPTIALPRQDPSGISGKDIFTDEMRWIGYAVVGDSLWVRVEQSEEPDEGISLYFILAGFRSDIPFAKMPNILITAENNKLNIFDALDNRYIYPEDASLEVRESFLIVKIPLSILGDPEYLFFGFETNAVYIPQGCTTFRMLEIEKPKADAEEKTEGKDIPPDSAS